MRCFFGHKWSSWSDVFSVPDGKPKQVRYCRKCRLADFKIVHIEKGV